MDKVSLRAKILKKRNKLSRREKFDASQKISKRLLETFNSLSKNNFLIYLAVKGEVDTSNIINYLFGKRSNLSVPAFFNNQYQAVRLKNFDNLELGPDNIPQPNNLVVADLRQIEVAIVPGVAFDKLGVRLGWGKGVYDRLLADFKGIKIGLAYEFQIVNELPKGKHDLAVDIIFTEKTKYEFI